MSYYTGEEIATALNVLAGAIVLSTVLVCVTLAFLKKGIHAGS